MTRTSRVAQTATPTMPAQVRCAVYTRKSTEEGLDQDFNSLDAQRDSGEACVRSHAGEGWVCLADRYDDGGFTGGNMERPALKRLMADIEAGKIDEVVVYKVDRLSRSLVDFAQMMQTFDKHEVSFVSVTQHFNTTNSMGRLMLHVLLSFAQFEREIISERTRDKIAATRRKGKWSGGHPILGYDVDPNRFRLLVNESEAERVRSIFALYLDHESLPPAEIELDKRDWLNKRWTTTRGEVGAAIVLDKVRTIGRDPALLGETLSQAGQQDAGRVAEMERDRLHLEKELDFTELASGWKARPTKAISSKRKRPRFMANHRAWTSPFPFPRRQRMCGAESGDAARIISSSAAATP